MDSINKQQPEPNREDLVDRDALEKIREIMHVLAHSSYDDAVRVQRMLDAGASGFVSKRSSYDELRRGISIVKKGGIFICSEVRRRMKNLSSYLAGFEPNLKEFGEIFSLREREVLMLLSHGKTSREIAHKLMIAERTIDSHRKNMMSKVEASNTVELVAYAASIGMLRA